MFLFSFEAVMSKKQISSAPGVSGNIKKVSHGPVVTLNEFEPAAGVKVSKIINLSDDIARNTSSESARISTIPGSNTIGIELPNNIRENVYLSEILANADFKKKEIKLPIALGKNISGKPVVGDLALRGLLETEKLLILQTKLIQF